VLLSLSQILSLDSRIKCSFFFHVTEDDPDRKRFLNYKTYFFSLSSSFFLFPFFFLFFFNDRSAIDSRVAEEFVGPPRECRLSFFFFLLIIDTSYKWHIYASRVLRISLMFIDDNFCVARRLLYTLNSRTYCHNWIPLLIAY